MPKKALTPIVLAAAFVAAGVLAPAAVLAQQPKSSPPPQGQPQQQPAEQQPAQQQGQLAPPKPYKAVPVTLPKPLSDASFEAFRKQLSGVAAKKDRAALARLVAQNFFWIPEDKDIADKKKPGIDNLAKAIGLDGNDPPGWELLAGYSEEPTADRDPQRAGVLCGPGEPKFDDKAAEELAKSTQTDPSEWGYPSGDGVPVRSGPEQNAPAVEKLGLHLVRVYPDDSPTGAVHSDALRIVTPSGKVGYVQIETMLPLVTDQLCYVKEGNAWKIAGAIGGVAPAQ
jgi:hypothetical protein